MRRVANFEGRARPTVRFFHHYTGILYTLNSNNTYSVYKVQTNPWPIVSTFTRIYQSSSCIV